MFIRLAGASAIALAEIASAQSNSVVAWGPGGCGLSGGSNYGQSCVPTKNNTDYVAVDGGMSHSIALKASGKIVAWGYNGAGQSTPPTPNSGFVAIAAGSHHNLARKADGSIRAWGATSYGQCNVPAPNTGGGVTTQICVLAVCPRDQSSPASLNDVLNQANTAAGAFDSPAGLHEHGLSSPLGPNQ